MTLADTTRIRTVVQSLADTSGTYTLDFTSAGLGASSNIKGYIVETGYGSTYGTAVDGVSFSWGCSDGTSHIMTSFRSSHGEMVLSDCQSRDHDDAVGAVMDDDADTVIVEIDHSAFITDGVRLSLTQNSGSPPGGIDVHVTIFAGPDVSIDVLQDTTPNTTGASKTVSPSYSTETSFVLCLAGKTYDLVADGTTAGAFISIGCATNEATDQNRAVMWGSTNGAATSDPFAYLRTDYCSLLGTSGSVTRGGTIANFQSNGDFDLTSSLFRGLPIGMFCVSLPSDVGVHLEHRSPPTTDGTESVTTPGFEPQALIQAFSGVNAVNTLRTNAQGAPFSFATVTYEGTDVIAYGHSVVDRDNQMTTDSSSLATRGEASTESIEVLFNNGTVAFSYEPDSFDSTGYTLDWTDTPAGDRFYWVLAIEQAPDLVLVVDETIDFAEVVVTPTDEVEVVDETVALAEVVVITSEEVEAVDETIAFAEVVVITSQEVQVVDETIDLAEDVTITSAEVQVVDETIDFAEVIATPSSEVQVVDETIDLAEDVVPALSETLVVDESIALAEDVVIVSSEVVVVDEAMTFAEGVVTVIVETVPITQVVDETLTFDEDVVPVLVETIGLVQVVDETIDFFETTATKLFDGTLIPVLDLDRPQVAAGCTNTSIAKGSHVTRAACGTHNTTVNTDSGPRPVGRT